MKDAIYEQSKPVLHLSVEQLPAIKTWEVGKKYKVVMEIRQVSKMERESEEHSLCGDFEVMKIKPVKTASEYNKDGVKIAMAMTKKEY